MKAEAKLFLMIVPFFVIVAVVYAILTGFEPIGSLGIPLVALLSLMIGGYLSLTSRHIDPRPEDDPEGEIADGAGDQGVFAPWSWWPLFLAIPMAISFLGLAVGWWLVLIGAVLGVVGLVGWVMEASSGTHAH